MAYRIWTDEEDAALNRVWFSDAPLAVLAANIGRPAISCFRRGRALGFPTRSKHPKTFADRRSRVCRELGAASLATVPEYRIWVAMCRRCENKDDEKYPWYGARGIKVCERWQEFGAFMADMGSRPSSKHSIERRDNHGGYGPENCEWADIFTQANNRRNNHTVAYRGCDMTLAQAIRLAGSIVGHHTARCRLSKSGWSVQEAVETPIKKRERAA